MDHPRHNSTAGRPAGRTGRRHGLLSWARSYFRLGLTPVPTLRTTESKGKPLVEWVRIGWKGLALQGEQPPWTDVRRAFRDAVEADGIALILRPDMLVLDTDGPAGEQFMLEHGFPECPQQASARGTHYWFALPDGMTHEGKRRVAPEVDAIGAGWLLYVVPSPDKKWCVPLQDADLPLAPPWALALLRALGALRRQFPASAEEAETPSLDPMTEEEIARYLQLVPGLKKRGPYKYVGPCPFHPDARPSFAVYKARRDGRLHWIDFAACSASLVRRRRLATGGVREYHGGTLRELQRLLRHGRGLDAYDRMHEAVNALDLSRPVRRLLMALLTKARACRLELAERIDFTYREIAEATGCEKVVVYAPDGRRRSYLSNNGRGVQRLLAELQRETGVAVEVGRSGTIGGGRRNTKLLVPRAWTEPYRRLATAAERSPESAGAAAEQLPADMPTRTPRDR